MALKTHAKFLEELDGRTLVADETYKGAMTKIAFRCNKCSHAWSATPNNILRGKGCPSCADSRRGRSRTNAIIEDHGDWLLIDVSTTRYPNSYMKIDSDVWGAIKNKGRAYCSTRGYVMQHRKIDGKHMPHRVHHDVISCEDGKERDHVNRNTLDNRRRNLRIVSHAVNMKNISLRSDNKSGHAGVWFCSRTKKWTAFIDVDGERIRLGSRNRKEEAISIREIAEKYYGFIA